MPATPDKFRYGIHAHAIDDRTNHEWYEIRPDRGGNNLSYDVKLTYIASGGRRHGVEKGQPPIDVVVQLTEAIAQPNRGERLTLLLIQRDLPGDARLAIPPRHAGLPNRTGSSQSPNPRARGIA